MNKYIHSPRLCGISGFSREVNENCALLGHYAACSDNPLPTFRGQKRRQEGTTTHCVTARKVAVLFPRLLFSVLLGLIPVCTLSYCRRFGVTALCSLLSALCCVVSLAVVYERLPFLSTSVSFAGLSCGLPCDLNSKFAQSVEPSYLLTSN